LEDIFTNRLFEESSWGNLAVRLKGFVLGDGNLSVLDELNVVLILEIGTNSRDAGE
jgi:hypothetical protein